MNITIVKGETKHAYSISVMTKHFFPYAGVTSKMIIDRMNDEKNEYFVALKNEHCVGFIGLDYSLTSAKIISLGVLTELRGKKIGEQILDYALKKARKKTNKIHALVAEENIVARKLYEKKGFKNKGKINRLIADKTVLLMAREI